MAVGFGFSIGDLFAGLRLLKDSIDAVHDTKGSQADYSSLTKEIICLQDGLEAVQQLQSESDLLESQSAALDRAAYACQESIDEFLVSISKYQPHLNARAFGVPSKYWKIKWALCKKDDVARFRHQIGRHASSINMLLITFQARQTLSSKKAQTDAIVKKESQDETITDMMKGLSFDQQQMFMALTHQNKQMMQNIEDLKAVLRLQVAVPPQVLLQQPVVFLDPFGKRAPFHLEFIDSPECFIAVLKARFSKAGVTPAGLSKLENHDFLLQDSRRRRPINLNREWSSVFRPGQNVDMSMVFHRFACPPSTCPVCLQINEDDDDDNEDEVHCQSCGLSYQNAQGIVRGDWRREYGSGNVHPADEEIPYMLRQPGKQPELKIFKPTKYSEDVIFEGYRRVQLVSQPLNLLDAKYPALQLIEDFGRFAELLKGVPEDTSAYLPDIRRLHSQAVHHLLQQRSSFPAFASFSQIEQVRNDLVQESLSLRRDIDRLVLNLYNDPDTKDLMKYLKTKYTSDHGRDYYTGVLTKLNSLSDFTKSMSPKVRSAERMQWRLLDRKSP
ncbi:hypothetical protein ACLMJK_006728 [Lecanora helva]